MCLVVFLVPFLGIFLFIIIMSAIMQPVSAGAIVVWLILWCVLVVLGVKIYRRVRVCRARHRNDKSHRQHLERLDMTRFWIRQAQGTDNVTRQTAVDLARFNYSQLNQFRLSSVERDTLMRDLSRL